MILILVILVTPLTQFCQTTKPIEIEIPELPTPKCKEPIPVNNTEFRLVKNGYHISTYTYQKIIAQKPLEFVDFSLLKPGFYISIDTYKKLALNTRLLALCIQQYHDILKSTKGN